MDASARPRINLLVATDTHSSSGAAFEVVFRGGATLPWLRSSPRGAVRVHVDGQWFVSGDAVDVPPGASLLVRGDVTNTSGRDRVLGQWTGVRVAWAAASTPVVTETRNYGGGWVTFDLSFPAGAQNVTLPGAATLRTRGVVQPYPKGLDAVSASFPTVDISCGADVGRLTCQLPRLSYATWWQDQQPNTQQLAAQQGVGLHSYFGGLVGGSPLVLFDESDGAYGGGMPTLVVSQAVHYRDTVLSAAASLELDSSPDGATSTDLQSGPHGYLTSVPAGTTFRTIMVAGSNGISRTLNDWGRKLLRMANKTVDHSTSLAANKIGYFTDNGAYYYYNVPSEPPNSTYLSTLQRLRSWHTKAGLPFAYYQLDSWMYPKGSKGGMLEWVAAPGVAPDGGLAAIAQAVGTPLVAHSRWLSADTVYAKDPAKYGGMVTSSMGAAPEDPLRFFSALIGDAVKGWNLGLYEQDWMLRCLLAAPEILTSFGAAAAWQNAMGNAAAAANADVGYGTGVPADLLQSVEMPGVVFAFAAQNPACPSIECPLSWQVGRTGLLANALGVLAFKDTFFSSQVETGNRWNASFVNCELHALASVLTGPVGPGDKLGDENVTLLMRTCRSDGTLLRPMRPAAAIDASFAQAWPGGEAWVAFVDTTYFPQPGNPSWTRHAYLLVAELRDGVALGMADLCIDEVMPTYRAFADSGALTAVVNATHPLWVPGQNPTGLNGIVPFSYIVLVPVFEGGWSLLGETSKFVWTAPARVWTITSNGTQQLSASIVGVEGESATITVAVGEETSLDVATASATCTFTGGVTRKALKCRTAGAGGKPQCTC